MDTELTVEEQALVASIARSMGGDEVARKMAEQKVLDTRLVRKLTEARRASGLSISAVAERSGLPANIIVRMENARDRDLFEGDVREYAAAVGLELPQYL